MKDSDDGNFHDPKYFSTDDRSYPNTKLRRAEHLKRRLVCVGSEDLLGVEIPLIHSSVNESVLKYHDKVTFYESLNEEIAFLVSYYDVSKAISLKAFFMDEAHLTCEWLVDMVERDLLHMFRSSDVNLVELKKQRESINQIRNELHGLLMHPAFSSRNMTPNRILRVSDDFNEWTPWQDANFNSLMRDYSHQCDKNGWWESSEGRVYDPEEKNARYCTYESSIIFIYNSEREKYRKPVEAVDLKEVYKKYRVELKNDPTFVAYMESKLETKKSSVAKKQQRRSTPIARPTSAPASPIRASLSHDARRYRNTEDDEKPKRSNSLSSLFGKKKNKDKQSKSEPKDATIQRRPTETLKRKSTSDLLAFIGESGASLQERKEQTAENPKESPSVERKKGKKKASKKMDRSGSVPPPPPSPSLKRKKDECKRKNRSSSSLNDFLKLAGCASKLLPEVPQMAPTSAANGNEAPLHRKKEKDKKKSGGGTFKILKALSTSARKTSPCVLLPPVTEEKEKEEEEEEKEKGSKKRKKRSKTLPINPRTPAVPAILKASVDVAKLSKGKKTNVLTDLLSFKSKDKKALTFTQ